MTARENRRIWVLDLTRGVFMLTMIVSHSVYFFHASTSFVLQTIAGFGDLVSFIGLLLISGAAGYAAYIHYEHPYRGIIKRVLKRVSMYLVMYYLLSFWASGLWKSFNSSDFWHIITFQKLVPFTEFVIPFLFFGLLKIPFRFLYQRLSYSWRATLVTGVFFYLISILLIPLSLPIPLAWKAIVVGSPGLYTFPLFSYLPVYLVGIYLGRLFWIHTAREEIGKRLTSTALVLGLVTVCLGVVSFTIGIDSEILFLRFPPSPGFLIMGITLSFLMFAFFVNNKSLINFPASRALLLLLGQNTFSILFAHTVLIYGYQFAGLPKVHSPILTMILLIVSLMTALYLAKILPLNYRFSLTFINWCTCHVAYCTHAKEHRILVLLKRYIFRIIRIPSLMSVIVGGHRYYLVKSWNIVLTAGFVLFAVTPLGIAENNQYFTQTIGGISGSVNRKWNLANQTAPLLYQVVIPHEVLAGQQSVHVSYHLNNEPPQQMSQENNTYSTSIRIDSLIPGTYTIQSLVDVNMNRYKTQPTQFYISHPVFVTWTIDWEGYDVPDNYLTALTRLSDTYQIPLTQMFNPRIYTSPDITGDRAEWLTEWVRKRHDVNRDEIGLHLHMFPDFVKKAGVSAITNQVWGGGFTPGYDILTTAYDYIDMKTILNYAQNVFVKKGLGVPTSYRAGAWFANSETLRALADSGFLVDSSGRTSYSFGTKQVSGFWDLQPTTQPYFPSIVNQNSPNPFPRLSILEIPNNGADDYAFSADEMIKRFTQNYNGGILTEPHQVTYLSHPNWFDPNRQEKMNRVFSHIENYAYKYDRGPVVFTTLQDVYSAWTDQQP